MQRAHKVTPQIDVSRKMEPACSGNVMSLSLVLAIGFAALVAASAATSQGKVFYVGDKDGWVSKPGESYDLWAARHSFTVSDTLVFKFKNGMDSLLVVDKHHYDTCNGTDPIDKLRDGNSTFVLDRTGPFYFITGDAGRCKKGQKLMVVVAAKMAGPPRGSRAPSTSPAFSPFNFAATSPNYFIAQSPLISSPTFEGPSSSPKPPPSFSPLPLSQAPSVTAKPKFHILAPTRSPSPSIPPMPPHKPQTPSVALSPTLSRTHLPSLAPKPHTLNVVPSHSPLPSSIPPSLTPKPQNPRIPISPTSSHSQPPSSLQKQKSPTLAPMHSPSSLSPSSTPTKPQPPSMAEEPALSHTHRLSPSPSPKSQLTMVAPTSFSPLPLSHAPSVIAKPKFHILAPTRSPSPSIPPMPPHKPQTPSVALSPTLSRTHLPSLAPKPHNLNVVPSHSPLPSSIPPSLTPKPQNPRIPIPPTSSHSQPPSSLQKQKSPTLAPIHSPSSLSPSSTPPKPQPPSMALEPALSHTHRLSPSPSPKSQLPMVAPIHPFFHSHPPSPHPKSQQPKVPTNRSPFSLHLAPAPEPQAPRIAPTTVMPYTISPSPSPKSYLEPLYTPLPSRTNFKASPISSPSIRSSSPSSHVLPSLSPHRSKDPPRSMHAQPPSLQNISPSPSSSISKTYAMHMPSQSPIHLHHPPSLSSSMVPSEPPSPKSSLAPSPISNTHPYIFGPAANSPTSLSPDQQLPPFLVPTIAPRPSHDHHASAPSMYTSMSILVSTLVVVVLTFIFV